MPTTRKSAKDSAESFPSLSSPAPESDTPVVADAAGARADVASTSAPSTSGTGNKEDDVEVGVKMNFTADDQYSKVTALIASQMTAMEAEADAEMAKVKAAVDAQAEMQREMMDSLMAQLEKLAAALDDKRMVQSDEPNVQAESVEPNVETKAGEIVMEDEEKTLNVSAAEECKESKEGAVVRQDGTRGETEGLREFCGVEEGSARNARDGEQRKIFDESAHGQDAEMPSHAGKSARWRTNSTRSSAGTPRCQREKWAAEEGRLKKFSQNGRDGRGENGGKGALAPSDAEN